MRQHPALWLLRAQFQLPKIGPRRFFKTFLITLVTGAASRESSWETSNSTATRVVCGGLSRQGLARIANRRVDEGDVARVAREPRLAHKQRVGGGVGDEARGGIVLDNVEVARVDRERHPARIVLGGRRGRARPGRARDQVLAQWRPTAIRFLVQRLTLYRVKLNVVSCD